MSQVSNISAGPIFKTVGEAECYGFSFIVLPGIWSEGDGAERFALFVSRALQNKKVSYLDVLRGLEDCVNRDSNANSTSIRALSQHVLGLISRYPDRGITRNRVIVFAHSHGAFITKRALVGLQQHKQFIEVYPFGGADIIPRNLGSVVKNFVNSTDLVACVGELIVNRDGPRDAPSYFKMLMP
ncbi:hypothetical protein [Candidatus Neptunochlamydia vexilliferae]|uniref:Uncharacterized protein n=1 Tax=Candidatus Neptunichlamydia vexilliferae TaxID=1651774 RepID=A0ABS0B0C2_9BACT|nr:hypothetical protein [Candidatus Neptunochlamydia vexilliferae]MBF5059817.1 hypothetical protein [Candidatus Neptunochlamydia vexilliferae]